MSDLADVADVLAVGCAAWLEPVALDAVPDCEDLFPGQPLAVITADDVGYLSPVDYVALLRVDFEVCFFGECYYGDVGQGLKVFQYSAQCAYMPGILECGVVEFVLVAVDVLGPVFSALAAVDPSGVVLGLEDEDSEDLDYQVVDLVAAAGRGDCDVVQNDVFIPGQPAQHPGYYFLADLAFHPVHQQPEEIHYHCKYRSREYRRQQPVFHKWLEGQFQGEACGGLVACYVDFRICQERLEFEVDASSLREDVPHVHILDFCHMDCVADVPYFQYGQAD